MDKKFTTPARITKAQTLSNGDLKLSIKTARNLDPDEVAKMVQYNQEEGWLIFVPTETDPETVEIPDKKPKQVSKGKTPSQRLRSVMWVRYKQKIGEEPDEKDFQNYYEDQMEQLIDKYKELLD